MAALSVGVEEIDTGTDSLSAFPLYGIGAQSELFVKQKASLTIQITQNEIIL